MVQISGVSEDMLRSESMPGPATGNFFPANQVYPGLAKIPEASIPVSIVEVLLRYY
jgi:hypothetical protein